MNSVTHWIEFQLRCFPNTKRPMGIVLHIYSILLLSFEWCNLHLTWRQQGHLIGVIRNNLHCWQHCSTSAKSTYGVDKTKALCVTHRVVHTPIMTDRRLCVDKGMERVKIAKEKRVWREFGVQVKCDHSHSQILWFLCALIVRILGVTFICHTQVADTIDLCRAMTTTTTNTATYAAMVGFFLNAEN